VRIDVGQIVAGMLEFTAAGENQPAAGPGARLQRGGEAALGNREADADVSAPVVPVGGVDADVDGLVRVAERTDPAADGEGGLVGHGDGVDAAADPPLGLPLVHRDVRLAEGAGYQRPVEQVT